MNKTNRKASRKFTRNRIPKDPKILFWKHVHKTETCWLWTASGSGPKGAYGGFNNGRKKVKAHRFSWEMHRGPIPEGLNVLHTCDVPRCVNPAHLFLGTHKDNTQDAIEKGRFHFQVNPGFAARGIRQHEAKLTDDKVFRLRRLRLKGVSFYRMAEYTGLSRTTVSRAVDGIQWAHVPFPTHTTDTLELHQF